MIDQFAAWVTAAAPPGHNPFRPEHCPRCKNTFEYADSTRVCQWCGWPGMKHEEADLPVIVETEP